MSKPEIIRTGKRNGEGMIIKYPTSIGTEIFALGIPNTWRGKGWDLGPTWCYLVIGDNVVLIDTGRYGTLGVFKDLLSVIGKRITDIDAVIPTHCHEDHDGNIAQIQRETNVDVWAHRLYPEMIAYHPQVTGGAAHPEMPGSCRLCEMPERFVRHCTQYHQERSQLTVTFTFDRDSQSPLDEIRFLFTPGHSPDSICIILHNEVIFTGDTILPGITPHPSRQNAFVINQDILPEGYRRSNLVYGLMSYINSLSRIARNGSQFQTMLPAHRLYYEGQFNPICNPSERAREIIEFHIKRCHDIFRIITGEPHTIDEIAIEHFQPSQLEGNGILMARGELSAHLEVMEKSGDIRWLQGKVQHTGTHRCLDDIAAYLVE